MLSLSTLEYDTIVVALEKWAAAAPDEPVLGFVGFGDYRTPWQVVSEVKQRSDFGKAVMEMIEPGVRRIGVEAAVDKITSQAMLEAGGT